MEKKKMREVCSCQNCGNEAEMIIECHLEEVVEEKAPAKKTRRKK